MIECNEAHIFGRHFLKMCRLYLTAFPKIERHPLRELFAAAAEGKAEFLRFSDSGNGHGKSGRFIGLAYMIVRGDVAFLLYFAVDGKRRNRGCGSEILDAIKRIYAGKDVVLLIESVHECSRNMEIRTRRKGFYLRNGFHDTGLIQTSCGGEANYDILNTMEHFNREAYGNMLAEYPFKSYLEGIYPAPADNIDKSVRA